MPELPEVETTRRGIALHLTGQRIREIVVRNPHLRWPIPDSLPGEACGRTVTSVNRRAKYLVLDTETGALLLHLGMSGSLRVLAKPGPAARHDHVDICFDNGQTLRFNDPRRFGCLLWLPHPIDSHPLLSRLGPEPLSDEFDGDYLYHRSRGRKAAIKHVIMDARIVVGVGNIYASEALFLAGISPGRAAGRVSRRRMHTLTAAIRQVLESAIAQGGTTLRDFVASDGQPGYFSQQLNVYGRRGEPCPTCREPIRVRRIGQRSTFFCARCQT